MTRRRFIGGGIALAALLTACGTDTNPSSGGGDAGPGFPVTIKHQYGSTTIRQAPQRVVTVGLTDHDPVLAFGMTPVGVAEWYGDYPYATWPWAQDELGDAHPAIIGGSQSYKFEKIAALRPDLITGVYSGMTANEYDTLAKIAPTAAQSERYPDYGTPWQQMTRTIGRAVGQADRAQDLIARVEGRFATARRRHPQFTGRTAAFVLPAPDGTYHAYASEDTRARFLTAFGFTIPQRIDELAGDSFYAEFSAERLGILDGVDVLVWDAVNAPSGKIPQIKNSRLYQQLNVAQQGRSIFVQDKVLMGAIAWSTVLSLPRAINNIAPRLAAAVDGNPATRPTPVS